MVVSSPIITHPNAPDGGWGWVVVFGSFMISLTCDGFTYTTGILYENFLEVYKESETITSLFDSVMTGMLFAMGPLASGLTVAYGCRTISIVGSILTVVGMLASIVFDSIYIHCLTLGVITGSGLGLIYLPQIVIVSYWFKKRLSLAIGIAVCGTGIGIAIFAVLTQKLIETFGWKGSMLLLSGIMSTNIFFSSLFRKFGDKQESQSLKSALKETFNFKILKEVLFLYYAFANFLNGTVYYVPIIFLKDHIKKTGIGSDDDAMKLMVIFGLSNAFGRALFGYIAENESLNRTILYAMSVLSYGLTIGLIAAFGSNFTLIAIGIVFFGVAEGLPSTELLNPLIISFLGAFVCLFSVVMIDLFGVKKVSNVFGITNLIIGIASFIGPPLIGKTADQKTGYRTGFYISSILTIISGILLMFLPIIQRKYKCIDN